MPKATADKSASVLPKADKAVPDSSKAPKVDAMTPMDKPTIKEQFQNKGRTLIASGEYDTEIMGTKRGTIEFIQALSDPRSEAKKDNTPAPVGYRLRLSEDVSITRLPFKEKPEDALDIDTEKMHKEDYKAGSIVDLNIHEMAALLSRAEYAGKINGGGKEVYMIPVTSGTDIVPHPAFRGQVGFKLREVYEVVAVKNENGNYVVKPEFAEQFGPLFVSKRVQKNKNKKKLGDMAAFTAAAFYQHYQTLGID